MEKTINCNNGTYCRVVHNLVDRTVSLHNRRIEESDLNTLSDEMMLTITDEDLPA